MMQSGHSTEPPFLEVPETLEQDWDYIKRYNSSPFWTRLLPIDRLLEEDKLLLEKE